MGLLKQRNRADKNELKKEQKESEEITKQFIDEYKLLREKYHRDFQAQLQFIEGGTAGIVPALRIIDNTKQLEAEQNKEKQNNEAEKKN